MKKLLYLSLAFCLLTTLASAQKITEKDLQGKWKLASFTADGITFDIEKGAVTISEEAKAGLPPEALAQLKANMDAAIEPFKQAFVIFEGNKVKQTMGTESNEGTFTVIEKDKQQYLHATYGEITDDAGVIIKDKRLHLTITGDGDDAQMIYTKQ